MSRPSIVVQSYALKGGFPPHLDGLVNLSRLLLLTFLFVVPLTAHAGIIHSHLDDVEEIEAVVTDEDAPPTSPRCFKEHEVASDNGEFVVSFREIPGSEFVTSLIKDLSFSTLRVPPLGWALQDFVYLLGKVPRSYQEV